MEKIPFGLLIAKVLSIACRVVTAIKYIPVEQKSCNTRKKACQLHQKFSTW